MRYLFFALAIFSASCTPSLNQVLKSPHLAEACATKYPVKDSTGEAIITYLPADNKDYTNLIDSLNGALYALSLRGYADSILLSDTGRCCEVAREYVIMADSAQQEFIRLKNSYRPCKPDTVKKAITVYRRDTAAEEVLRNLYETYRDKYVKAQASADNWKDHAITLMWVLIAMAGIILIFVWKGNLFGIISSLFKRKS